MFGVSFTLDEVNKALSKTKLNEAAGFDGIYPKFIKHTIPRVREWVDRFYSDIQDTTNIPKQFKWTKVIALLRTGKSDGNRGCRLSPNFAAKHPIQDLGKTYPGENTALY